MTVTFPTVPDNWENKGRGTSSAAVFALLLIGIVYFYGQYFLVFSAVLVRKGLSGSMDQTGSGIDLNAHLVQAIRIILFCSQYLLMLLPSFVFIRRWHADNPFTYIRVQKTSPLILLASILGAVGLLPLSIAFSSALIQKLGIPAPVLKANGTLFTSYSPAELAWLIVVVGLTPAVCEEFFFRGHFQRTLERTVGWKSILIAGTVFGLFHFQPLGLMSLSLVGLFLGYVYYRSGSILPSMAAHCTNNVAVLLLDYRPFTESRHYWDYALDIPLPVIILSSTGAAVMIFVIYLLTRKREPSAGIVPEQGSAQAPTTQALATVPQEQGRNRSVVSTQPEHGRRTGKKEKTANKITRKQKNVPGPRPRKTASRTRQRSAPGLLSQKRGKKSGRR